MKLNLITVCTDQFPPVYVDKLIKKFKTVSDLEFAPYCITDRPKEVEYYAQPLEPPFKLKHWWNKMFLYSTLIPSGINIYMDLDIVIIKNFDAEIEYAVKKIKEGFFEIACVSDCVRWKNNKFSSSFMIFQTGKLSHIFKKFKNEYNYVYKKDDGGDQVWTGPLLNEILYIDEVFPDLKKNLKYQIATEWDGQRLILPNFINDKIKLIDCGGWPKPHEINNIPYIVENWQKV